MSNFSRFIKYLLLTPLALLLWLPSLALPSASVVALLDGAGLETPLGQALYRLGPDSPFAIRYRPTPEGWDALIMPALAKPIWLNILIGLALAITATMLSYLILKNKTRYR